MNKDFINAVVKTALVAGFFLIANYLLYLIPGLEHAAAGFAYPLYKLYLLFFVFAVIILFSLYRVSAVSAAQVGYVFLGLSSLKVVGAYFVARPILAKTIDAQTEKVNFLFVFLLFLTLEAYFTAQLLNKKQ